MSTNKKTHLSQIALPVHETSEAPGSCITAHRNTTEKGVVHHTAESSSRTLSLAVLLPLLLSSSSR